MNNIVYYHSGDTAEIQAVLRDGFTDITATIDGVLKRGVYITDAPGEWDLDYPNDQLLQITLPPEIDLRKWRLVFVIPEKPCRWSEWVLPSDFLNTHARVRLLTTDEWKEVWAKKRIDELMRAFDHLVASGYLEIARDARGEAIRRRGEPAYRWSEKGRRFKPLSQEPPSPPQE
jgi:hypothetical protein